MKLVFSRRLLLIPAAIVALFLSNASTAQEQQAVEQRNVKWCFSLECECPDGGSCSNQGCDSNSHAEALAMALSHMDTCCVSAPNCTIQIWPENSPPLTSDIVVTYCCQGKNGGTLKVCAHGGSALEAAVHAGEIMGRMIYHEKFGGPGKCTQPKETDACGPTTQGCLGELDSAPAPVYSHERFHNQQPCCISQPCYVHKPCCRCQPNYRCHSRRRSCRN